MNQDARDDISHKCTLITHSEFPEAQDSHANVTLNK